MTRFVKAITTFAFMGSVLAVPAHAQEGEAEGPVISGNFNTWVGNDYVTPHGLVATTRGVTIQTDASVSLTLPSGVNFTGGV